eukprot:9106956-Ditylum_brightwellii.AAC.1
MAKGVCHGGEECRNHWDMDTYRIHTEYTMGGYPTFQRIQLFTTTKIVPLPQLRQLQHCCYVILYNDAQSLCEGTDGKLIYQEVKDKEEDASVSSEVICSNNNERIDVFLFCTKQSNAIGADPSSKM